MPSIAEFNLLRRIRLAKRIPVSRRIGRRLIHPDRNEVVYSVQYSPDGSKIFGNTYPRNNIQIWDKNTGKQLVTIDAPDGLGSWKFAFPSPDFEKIYTLHPGRGKYERVEIDGKIATKSEFPDNAIQIWNPLDGSQIGEHQESLPNGIMHIENSLDGKFLITNEEKRGTWIDQQPRVYRVFDMLSDQWKQVPEEAGSLPVLSQDSSMVATFAGESVRYINAISIFEFPSFRLKNRVELPPGIHAFSGGFRWTKSDKYLFFEYRTYPRKGSWNQWQSHIACIDVVKGKIAGSFKYPFENGSPLFGQQMLREQLCVFSTWSPSYSEIKSKSKKLMAIQIPSMKKKWETEVGDYYYVQPPVVNPDGKWFAVFCISEPENSVSINESIANPEKVRELTPQPELKIFDGQTGKLLETIVMPVGATDLVFSPDGKSAAFGAVGSVYQIDLSRPFENE